MGTTTCPTCGAKMVKYKHGLSKGLVRALAKMAKRCRPGESIHVGRLNLTHTEAANFQKLRYFGVVRKDGDPEGKGGNWIFTQTGYNFITGAMPLPKYVRTYQADVVERSDEQVWVGDVTGGWKYRPDYAREAVPHAGGEQSNMF